VPERHLSGRAQTGEDDVEILLLGSVQARRRGRPVHLVGAKQRTLLAALALEANRVVTDDRLIDLLWPEEPPENAEDVLRVHVSKLRRAVERDAALKQPEDSSQRLVVRKPSGYQLSIADDRIDLARCRHLVAEARRARQARDDSRALRLLDEALALWRGDPLPEFSNEAFAMGERSQLEKLHLETLEERFDTALALGMHTVIVAELEAAAAKYPLRERLQAQLMLALYRSGRQAEASDVYHRTRKRLIDDLGMEPGPDLQTTFRDILNQEPSAAPAVEAAWPRPAGEQATKRHNIPAQVSSFVGRESTVADLTHALANQRLVTLVGPGGIGKTRLAAQVARQVLDRYPDGVWWIDLVPVDDPATIAQVIHTTLGLPLMPSVTVAESLLTVLGSRKLLLVLDNCEHLVDAAAQVSESVLRVCDEVTVLATSRERLNIPGEQVWPISPLTLPSGSQSRRLEELSESEAIQLFIDRARMARPTFQLTTSNATAVAEICNRLDGIPLALELAAARTGGLPINELVERLTDRFGLLAGTSRTTAARHHTMRETLDWSSALLSDEERLLFYRLGAFAGSFELPAVEVVCADELLKRRVIAPTLARLVDKSLVVLEPSEESHWRYHLLETMREYVRDKTSDSDVSTLKHRHAMHYLETGRACERLYIDGKATAARERYHLDYSDARVAIEWSLENAPELGVEIGGAWRFYWWLQGLLSDGRQLLQRAVECTSAAPAARARALSGLGRIAAVQGDVAEAVAHFEAGLALARDADDTFMIAELTHSLGVVHVGGATNAQAERFFAAAVEMWQKVGYGEGLATAYGNLGECCFYAGKYDEARMRFLQQIEMGRDYSRFNGLVNLSHLECFLGNYTAAREHAAEALRLASPLYAAVAVEALAFLFAAQEQAMRAATLSAATTRLYAAHGAHPEPTPNRETAEAKLREVISRLDARTLALARERGAEMSLDEVIEYALNDAVPLEKPAALQAAART
jgi:predicted ATPase/DNA-binding SARP family transcriptional activator